MRLFSFNIIAQCSHDAVKNVFLDFPNVLEVKISLGSLRGVTRGTRINVERFPAYIFIPREFVTTRFINERKIPTNGVLDVCYPYLGRRLFDPCPAYGDARLCDIPYRRSATEKSRQLHSSRRLRLD